MKNTLKLHEAEVEEVKEEKQRCKSATLENLANLYKLLNGSVKENSEEEAAAVETVAQV